MNKILIFFIIFTSLSLNANDTQRKAITDKQLQIAMDKEKKHAKEQTFHQAKSYDFKSAEVNPDSLASIPDDNEELDDFDMDDVY